MEVDVNAALECLEGNCPPVLLDVREHSERDYCHLGEGLHVPTGEVQFKWNSLPLDQHILVYCHHGMRSLRVTAFLREKGFQKVQSIKGGIDAWSREIDPMVPRY
jgi:rhodanese-related sulfurtransferase